MHLVILSDGNLITTDYMENRRWIHCALLPSHLRYSSSNREWAVTLVSVISSVSSNDEQDVSDTALFPCQAVSSIMSLPWPIVGEWLSLLYFSGRQSHQLCFISWPTGSEWQCFISLPGSLINHVSSHDKQAVSDTALFHCQAVSSIISHPMTNRQWVNITTLCLWQAISSIMFHPMTNRQWVMLL